jgi:hypothetical protein
LIQRYHILKRWYDRSDRPARLREALPPSLYARLSSLVAKDKAVLLWNSNAQMPTSTPIRSCIDALYTYLANSTNRWKQPIAFIVPRVPHAVSLGDLSQNGGGGYCAKLRFWFDLTWSDRIKHATKSLRPTDPDYVHINSLEFIVVVLQLIAVATRLASLSDSDRLLAFPDGLPTMPVLLSHTDNTSAKSWANRVTSKSSQGQRLIGLYAEILRTCNIGLNCDHIAGVKNAIADFISRPTHFNLSYSERAQMKQSGHLHKHLRST